MFKVSKAKPKQCITKQVRERMEKEMELDAYEKYIERRTRTHQKTMWTVKYTPDKGWHVINELAP